MSEYKDFLASQGIQTKTTSSNCELVYTGPDPRLAAQVESLFHMLDTDADGLIGVPDAERLLLKLNTVYGLNYGEAESQAFFAYLLANNANASRGLLDLKTFMKAFAEY